VAACSRLVRPGGQVFFSTINRNPKAWVMAIFGAEYVLRLLPRGTHEYAKLIRPSELAGWIRESGLELAGFTGMHYNPFTRACTLGGNVDVNYLAHSRKPGA
jgi:2-polyprenyl-6-hydroxyphenyl methylase / 3-demethylubiquinone-9 3-methyltransferase